jgi:hypothetical protein
MIPPFAGRCLCGATRYSCKAEPLWQSHCHCESCRRATSSPMTSMFAVADGAWLWTADEPQMHRSSPEARRYFCATCGSPMGYRHDSLPHEMHFYAASLDHPETFHPTQHDFWAERLEWLHVNDGLPHA